MRLLFVHERKGAFGGAEANVLVTATELRERGHTVGLAHGEGTGRGEQEWESVFSERFHLPAATTDGGRTVMQQALAAFAPETIFVHKMPEAGVLEALADSGCPTVRMVHDHDLWCMRSYRYNPLSRHICTRPLSLFCVFPCGGSVCRGSGGGLSLRWVNYSAKRRELELNRRFHRLIVASDYMRAELLRNGFSAGQIEIHAPVPRAAGAMDTASFGARNRLVYAGQIVRGKGVDVLLEALARVAVPFECIIIGDGSHRPACEKLRDQLGLEGKVTFVGFQPQEKIAGYYRDASVALMSSVWPEPFGATGLEAMRCGLPVVAFDAGGICEWLLDNVNGFVVPWMNRAKYAGRIEQLLTDKALARRLGEQGRNIAAQRFNFSAYVGGLEDLFFRAAGKANPSTSTPPNHV